MTRIVDVPVEPLSHDSFSPFGEVLASPKKPTAWSRPGLDAWRMDFSIAGSTELEVVRFHFHEKMEFDLLERHIMLTEARIPMQGSQAVMVVAPPSEPFEPADVPDPGEVRAFLLDGTSGILLWRGTWHALDAFAVRPPYAEFAFISEAETEKEIHGQSAPVSASRTHVANYRERDVRFRITDPKGLLVEHQPLG